MSFIELASVVAATRRRLLARWEMIAWRARATRRLVVYAVPEHLDTSFVDDEIRPRPRSGVRQAPEVDVYLRRGGHRG